MREKKPRKIRFGIISASEYPEAWQIQAILKLLELDNVSLEVILILRQTGRIDSWWVDYLRVWGGPKALRTLSYENLDEQDFAFCRIDAVDNRISLTEKEFNEVRNHNLDFLLCFAEQHLPAELLSIPRHGVWSFIHVSDDQTKPAALSLTEIRNKDILVKTILQRNNNEIDRIDVLKTGVLRAAKYTYSKNVDNFLFECCNWPAQVCKKILAQRPFIEKTTINTSKVVEGEKPGVLKGLSLLTRMAAYHLAKTVGGFFQYEEWNVGYVSEPVSRFLDSTFEPQITWLPKSKKNSFRADPCFIAVGSKKYLFYEHYDYHSGIGNISCQPMVNEKHSEGQQVAIETEHHLSYPYLLKHRGEIYCVPETCKRREIALYRAEKFPAQWTKQCILVDDVAAVDSTIFRYKEKWWLASTIQEHDPNLNLFLWYSSDLFGPWTMHEFNPVKTDIRSSRPAGRPFTYNGDLFRPAQDCSTTYGGGISINRIRKLTTTEFAEETVSFISPNGNDLYFGGFHTLSANGGITFLDGKRYVFNLSAFKRTIKKSIARKVLTKFRPATAYGY